MKNQSNLNSVRKKLAAALKYFGAADRLSIETIELWVRNNREPVECFKKVFNELKLSSIKEANSVLRLLQELWNLTPRPELMNRTPQEVYSLSMEFGVPLSNFGLKDVDVLHINLVKDFDILVNYLSRHSIKLTGTGNICLKDLRNINSMLSIKVKWEQKIHDRIYGVRSEDELSHIQLLDTLARCINLVKEMKTKLVPTPTLGKFEKLGLVEKYGVLLEAYINCVNWEFIHPSYSLDEPTVGEIMQDNFKSIALLLLELQRKATGGWVRLDQIATQIAERLDFSDIDKIDINPKVLRWEIERPIVGLLTLFDLAKVKKRKDKWGIERPWSIQLNRKGKKVLNILAYRPY